MTNRSVANKLERALIVAGTTLTLSGVVVAVGGPVYFDQHYRSTIRSTATYQQCKDLGERVKQILEMNHFNEVNPTVSITQIPHAFREYDDTRLAAEACYTSPAYKTFNQQRADSRESFDDITLLGLPWFIAGGALVFCITVKADEPEVPRD